MWNLFDLPKYSEYGTVIAFVAVILTITLLFSVGCITEWARAKAEKPFKIKRLMNLLDNSVEKIT